MRSQKGPSGSAIIRGLLVLVLGAGSSLMFAGTAQAATINVTTDDDELNSDGDCSLREAIEAANINSGVDACAGGQSSPTVDTINIPNGVYTLDELIVGSDTRSTGDLDIIEVAHLAGTSRSGTIVEAGTAAGPTGNGIDRVFDISSTTVSIDDLTVRNGRTGGTALNPQHGGGIRGESATVTLERVTLRNNMTGTGSYGGGISVDGTLTLLDTEVIENTAGQHGGGINKLGTGPLDVTGGEISDNNASAPTGAGGGANIFGGSATFTDVSIQRNEATGSGGGGIYACTPAHPQLTLTDVVVANNEETTYHGGGVFVCNHDGSFIVRSSIVRGNSAHSGGGIYNMTVMDMTESTVKNNLATGGGDAEGGGLYTILQPVAIYESTFSGNKAPGGEGGAVMNNNRLTLTNSTLSENEAESGGGVTSYGELYVWFSTFSENIADAPSGGGALLLNGSETTIGAAAIGNSTGGDCVKLSGTFSSDGNNVVEDPGACPFLSVDEVADPELLPLADYGGPTNTHALELGSPALDVVAPTNCSVTEDQRGHVRPQDGPDKNTRPACESGSFEADAPLAHQRDVSLALSRHLKAKGRVTVDNSFNACRRGVKVKVQRKGPSRWKTVEATVTGDDGFYKTSLPDKPGPYRAKAPKAMKQVNGRFHACDTAVSPKETHKHN